MTAEELINKNEQYDLGYLIMGAKRRGYLIALYEKQINAFHEKFPNIELLVEIDKIILNRPDREEMLVFLQCFGGDWKKEVATYDTTKMNYVQEVDSGLTLQVTYCEPPPNCKIVEEDVVIPATLEHTEKRKVIKCTSDEKDITNEIHP